MRLCVKLTNQEKIHILSTHNVDRKSTRLNSSHTVISYAVFCLKKKKMESLRLLIILTVVVSGLYCSVHLPLEEAGAGELGGDGRNLWRGPIHHAHFPLGGPKL